jgi:non-homologous end joining protein Ku
LIEAKGKRLTAPHEPEAPAVINLMDALRQSLDQAKKKTGSAATGARAAHVAGHKATRSGRRKTG